MFRVLGRRVTVPIKSCVHYGAFRYGRGENHPYETYARKLVQEEDRGAARAWFVNFIRHYRPRHFGEALGVELAGRPKLWQFPWEAVCPAHDGWFPDPLNFDDIVTQYNEEGLLWFRIEQEFFWLERAIYSIKRTGYVERPHFGLFARRLVDINGDEAFLILDGNHRLSALAALGHETITLSYLPHESVFEAEIDKWPQVRDRRYTKEDARMILRAYFSGNPRWSVAPLPAIILEMPPEARALYL